MTRPRLLVVAGVLVAALGIAAPAAAQGGPLDVPEGPAVDLGTVVVVDADNPGSEVSGGGSADPFSLRPPADATCPGDSASDNWRISSFIVPADQDLADLEIGPFAPEGDDRWPLYTVGTRAYINEALIQNFDGDQPARLAPVPALSFGVFPTDVLPPGEYRIGLACSKWKVVTQYWDTAIVIAADADDEPAAFRWTVVDAPEGSPEAGAEDDGINWSFALVGLGLLAVIVFVGVTRVSAAKPSRPSGTSARAADTSAANDKEYV